MLDNYLDLVKAVELATRYTQTEANIADYEHHMERYLRTLLELYPQIDIQPYQHLALHFGEHLRRFGPTHSWRCFPFERYNGILQRIPTNLKFGMTGFQSQLS